LAEEYEAEECGEKTASCSDSSASHSPASPLIACPVSSENKLEVRKINGFHISDPIFLFFFSFRWISR
jgi:hypothetical protein